jgi:UDP-perosamine 4-acetyltransferase
VSRGIVVVGAGGHAKVCIELFRAMSLPVDLCIGSSDSPADCLGVPVLPGNDHIARLRSEGYDRAFIAVGNNGVRRRLGELATAAGYALVNAISPNAVVSPSATLGRGVAIMSGVVINAESVVRDLAIINTGATIDHDCVIGEAAHVAPQSGLAGNVSVGCCSFLGVGTKVIPGCRIGDDVIIGAGGVVISDIPDGVTAVGVPARIVSKTAEKDRPCNASH